MTSLIISILLTLGTISNDFNDNNQNSENPPGGDTSIITEDIVGG